MIVQIDVKALIKTLKELAYIYYGQMTIVFSHLAEVVKATLVGLFVRKDTLCVSYVVPYRMHSPCSIVKSVCGVVVPEPFTSSVTVHYGDLMEALSKVKQSNIALLEFNQEDLRIDCQSVSYVRRGSIPRLLATNVTETFTLGSDFMSALTRVNRVHTDKKKSLVKAVNENPIWFIPNTGCIITNDNVMQVSYFLSPYNRMEGSAVNFETFLLRLFEPFLGTSIRVSCWDNQGVPYVTIVTPHMEMTYEHLNRKHLREVKTFQYARCFLERRVLLNMIPSNLPIVDDNLNIAVTHSSVVLSSNEINTCVKGSYDTPFSLRLSCTLLKKALSIITSKSVELGCHDGMVQLSPKNDFSEKFYVMFRTRG